ncbi:IS30 family transposase [Nostocoides jenkinsii]|uniref:Transposase n=1 Tax=Nostocoides jenkinsii Ben 74 TaxID=1193518 RepID=A0A077M8N4_9MICO|nr:IS30 family transposase [Tetrasphaera jenkinsii]CCI51465.1 transposase [Tetrasphaera jenkinsii Ben 74]CCI51528.1 transposase [Tetrasphaera jenkinsii Ben 74]CCI51958.1 transposase [Tetrasphaera jenkinsii Ben 74]CCI51964.1 transposase [Tetrasphaera jenkinsii Ben 74]CCI52291.1 transposase [Tetrasphaera jenkinsii Ben 74]
MAGTRRQLTIKDRAEISAGLKAGWSPARIARDLGRDRSVITREIARNSTKTCGYRVVSADVRAQRRRARPQPRKVAADPLLGQRVLADLRQSRTPRQIAGRLKLEAEDATVEVMKGSLPAGGLLASHEAIYQFIYAMPRAELVRHGVFLRSKRTQRKPRSSSRRGAPIVGMRPITARENEHPGSAERRVPGHWEGDLIIGKNGASAAATMVERMSRYTVIVALHHGKSSDDLAEVLIEHVNALPEMMRASLTWDQGSEMARHAALTVATDLPVYFADPHSPWQRPSNENTNGLIREYIPKGENIPAHQPYLNSIAEELNERPRAVLGYLTPRESFERLLLGQPHVATTP